ncbi:hypothetical protein B0H14DRAFT_2595500 [Mycena olivaceomarginata]|nr:hypothetical protein B0H14DRAFT_2595500 [Mycena olivaceomarginata]
MGSVQQHCKLRRSLRDHPGITGRQRGLWRLQWGSRMTGATLRGSGTAYSSGGIGWIDSEDQPSRVGGYWTHQRITAWQRLVQWRNGAAHTSGVHQQDGCRREEDDLGSGTRQWRAARLPGIGFMRAVSRGEAEATARALLEVGRAMGRVVGVDNDNGARGFGAGWTGSTREAVTVTDQSPGWDELGWLRATVGGGGSNTAQAGRINLHELGAGLAGFGRQDGWIELGQDGGFWASCVRGIQSGTIWAGQLTLTLFGRRSHHETSESP